MTTLVNIARYHLVDRLTYLVLPWGVMVFSFLANLIVAAVVPPSPDGYFTGGLVTIYIFLLICGTLSMTRSLPFGLMLGVSRRSYYLGTALLVVLLGAIYALGLTVLQAIERATGGWGLGVHFFRLPWIMDGPWYQTWLTSFVLLVLFFLHGMWYGLVYRRWNVPGLLAFIAAQILAALGVVVVVSVTHNYQKTDVRARETRPAAQARPARRLTRSRQLSQSHRNLTIDTVSWRQRRTFAPSRCQSARVIFSRRWHRRKVGSASHLTWGGEPDDHQSFRPGTPRSRVLVTVLGSAVLCSRMEER